MQTHPLKTYQKQQARRGNSIESKKGAFASKKSIVASKRGKAVSFFRKRVPRKAVVDFTRSFALMIKARLSLIQALDTATGQCENEAFKSILLDVKKQVESGKKLSDSFSKHNHIFDPLYINLTSVGEMAGILDQVLLRIASHHEKTEGMRRKIKQALAYPIMVLVVAVGATAFLLTTIVPTFADMFSDFGAELPAPTQFILTLSSMLTQYKWLLLLIFTAIGVGIKWLRSKSEVLLFIDRYKLKLPLIGSLIKKSLIARFCRTLGTLLESGVVLVDALEILARATGNRYLDRKMAGVTRQVRQGRSLHKQVQQTALFPDLVVHMIMVGEQTAELDKMLTHAAEYYEMEVDVTLESVGAILEPVLIVLIGLILGGILVALYLPMFDLVNVVG